MPHPTASGKTLWDAIDDEGPFKGLSGVNNTIDSEFLDFHTREQESSKSFTTKVEPLGSGSDYTVFLQRLGVASSDEGFGFTMSDAVYHYHSIYDSQSWQERYGDRGFHRHVCWDFCDLYDFQPFFFRSQLRSILALWLYVSLMPLSFLSIRRNTHWSLRIISQGTVIVFLCAVTF